jgi:predicted RNA binding protein YcfA (HicA-like mRNA interferase family)
LVQGYTKLLKQLLVAHGCRFLRQGKGDHEVWACPKGKRPIVVDGKIMSRTTANAILKQAGINEKLS